MELGEIDFAAYINKMNKVKLIRHENYYINFFKCAAQAIEQVHQRGDF